MDYTRYFVVGLILTMLEIIAFTISMQPADPQHPTIKDFFKGLLLFYLINTLGIVIVDRII